MKNCDALWTVRKWVKNVDCLTVNLRIFFERERTREESNLKCIKATLNMVLW